MAGVADFCVDAAGNALVCVTQEGVVSFGIETARQTALYTGSADQAMMCGKALMVRTGGAIVRVLDGQSVTIRRDSATWMGIYGEKVIQLTPRGVVICDANGENATTVIPGQFETASVAGSTLYVGNSQGYTQYVQL